MTTTVKAKCPGCGDEEGSHARGLSRHAGDWRCGECNAGHPVSEWLASGPTRLHPDDIEAIASRVVELMRETE